jgi:hypothetical protein
VPFYALVAPALREHPRAWMRRELSRE